MNKNKCGVNKFQVGEKVFAKLRGYPPWPAKILEITSGNANNPQFLVYFYGSEDIAFCRAKNLYSLIEKMDELGKPKKLQTFNRALINILSDLTAVEKKQLLTNKPKTFVKQLLSNGLTHINGKSSITKNYRSTSSIKKSNRRNTAPYAAFEFDKERVVIADEPKRVSYHKIECRLVAIDNSIRKCLRLSLYEPDLMTCINLLDELLELKVSPLMIKKSPDVVETIRCIRRYSRPPPVDFSSKKKQLFLFRVSEIKERAERVILKYRNLFPDLSEEESFFDYYERIYNDFFESEIQHMSIQQFVNWIEM